MLLSAAAWHAGASLLAPGAAGLLRRRAANGKEVSARLPERRGLDATRRPPGPLIWVHAASVGEAVSVLPVLDHLQGATTVLMTTGTVTSAQLVAARAPGVIHRFAPWDVPRWVDRFLDHWRPDAAAFVESELWPNTLAACARRGTRLLLLNARLSARSARAWGWAPGLARRTLGAFHRVHAQSSGDAARLSALGARDVRADGDLKFAAPPLPSPPGAVEALQAALAGRPAWLAASTHEGEEAVIREAAHALRAAHPGLLTVVVPRHPARGPAASAALADAPLRSHGATPGSDDAFYVADTLGELGTFYRAIPVVLMGKTLLPPGGGHNPLEPARLGCALAAGPHAANFAVATDALLHAGAMTTVADAAALASWVDRMLSDPAARAAAGAAGQRVARADEDLPRRLAAELLELAKGTSRG